MNLSGAQKVAVLLMGIGKDASAEIMREMDKDELARILHAMQQLRKVDQKTVDSVFLELHEVLKEPAQVSGGQRSIAALMDSAFGSKADEMSAKMGLDKPLGLPALKKLTVESISGFLRGEHPQTVALVLAHLPASKFRDVLRQLQSEKYVEILTRVARLEAVDPDTIAQLNETLDSIAKTQQVGNTNLGGVEKIAAMLNSMDAEQGNAMLAELNQRDPELVEKVKQLMFTFNDLILFDQKNLAELLKQVDRKQLLLAMKLANEDTVKHIYSSMSSRAATLLKEDYEAQGKARKSDVETAQKNIAELARILVETGKIHMQDSNEVYVA